MFLDKNSSSKIPCPYWPPIYNNHGQVAMIFIGSLVVLIAVPGNFIIILTILRSPRLRNSASFIFLLSVTMADFLVSLLAQPMFISVIATQSLHYSVCTTSVIIAFISGGSSITGILGVTLDRFVFIVYPYKYRSILTRRRAFCIIFTFWGLGITLGALHVIWYNKLLIQIAIFALIASSSIASICANMRFLAMALSRKEPDIGRRGARSNRKRQIQTTRLIVKISLAFGLCWMPYGIIGLVYAAMDEQNLPSSIVPAWYWSLVLGYSNSALNILIYGKNNTILLYEVKKLLRIHMDTDVHTSMMSTMSSSGAP